MNNKSKGFTLIELIGVIVIVALLALLITPLVNNVLTSSKSKLYKNTLKNIELSAKDWFIDEDNIEKLPGNVENCYINLSELKSEGVVDLDIKNPETGNPLDDTQINVLVKKVGKSYEFKVVDDGSVSGGQCTEYAPNILAPTITATTFKDYKTSFALNITYENLISADGQSFEYYVSDSSNSLHGSNWTGYTNGTAQTIGTGKTGTYYVFVKRLSNVIDGQTNISTLGGVLVKIGNETYHRFGPYKFDNTKPVWSFYQKSNTNKEMNDELENMNYAYQEHTVKITFRGTDENYQSNNLNINNIIIKIGDQDISSSANKSLSAVKSLGNGVEYTLTLSNMTQKGKLSIILPSGTITDKAGNINDSTTIETEVKVNMCNYANGKTWTYSSSGRQSFKVPCDGKYYIETLGAKGGGDKGGNGAKAAGEIVLKRGTILTIEVGGRGGRDTSGYNGGGKGWQGGGGATDIRVGGTGSGNRIIVAGGGGGAGQKSGGIAVAGGQGGKYNGSGPEEISGMASCTGCVAPESGMCAQPGSCSAGTASEIDPKSCVSRYATGGTQTSGGLYGATVHFNAYIGIWSGYSGTSAGKGGDGMAASGGGGGFYGGGGSSATITDNIAGAGGSSCISTNEDSEFKCKNNNFLFTNIDVVGGANSGSGKATIRIVEA